MAGWAEEPGDDGLPGSVEEEFQRYARQLEGFTLISARDSEQPELTRVVVSLRHDDSGSG